MVVNCLLRLSIFTLHHEFQHTLLRGASLARNLPSGIGFTHPTLAGMRNVPTYKVPDLIRLPFKSHISRTLDGLKQVVKAMVGMLNQGTRRLR